MKKIGIISFVVILVDRIIKLIVDNNLLLNQKNEIIRGFFSLTKCYNDGAAFSIFSGNVLFLIFITGIALYVIFRFVKNNKEINKFQMISYGLLIGGIIGNLIDRLVFNYVIDYLDFIIFKYDFAIFNFADSCIVIGAIMLLFTDWGEKDGKKREISSN